MNIGNVELGIVPRVAAPFRDDTPADTFAHAAKVGLDIVELRIDQFEDPSPANALDVVHRTKSLPVLATVRSAKEGGEWTGGDDERLALIQSLIPEVDAVDIELSSTEIYDAVQSLARSHGKVVVGSFHDFSGTPPVSRLDETARRAEELGSDICKIAVTANSPADIRRLAAFTARQERPSVVIAMGAFGGMSRVFFPGLGSLFTFAHFGWSSAPGQMNYGETAHLLARFYPEYAEEKRASLQRLNKDERNDD